MEGTTTLDSLMTDFVCDMTVADDELSDSIFTCVDNFIDGLCLKVMTDEDNIFEDEGEGNLPFNFIVDKVLEKIDTLESIADEDLSTDESAFCNSMDPDYCTEINFDEIDPEDFQLFIPQSNFSGNEGEEDYIATFSADDGTNMTSTYDAIFNA